MHYSLPILTFHSIDLQSSVISFHPNVFKRSIAKIHEYGYHTLRLSDAVDHLRQGKPFPEKSLVITFDDGYQSVFDEAYPVLLEYGMSAMIFLTVGKEVSLRLTTDRLPSLNGRSMLSWEQIGDMKRNGIDIGAHTLTHADLTSLPVEHVEEEIYESKSIIEDALSAPVNCFSYPFGRYDERSRKIVKRLFACACTDQFGLVKKGCDPYILSRIDAYYFRTDRLFDIIFSRFFPSYINAINFLRRIRRSF